MRSFVVLLVPIFLLGLAQCRSGPAPSNRSATWFCPARSLTNFPDPVPSASFEAVMPRRHVMGGARSATLRQVSQRLEALLVRAAFGTPTYLGFGCAGFALVADLERIHADGTPFEGDDRFGPGSPSEVFDLQEVTARLHYAPNGFYRQVVFLVADDPAADADSSPLGGDLGTIVATGQNKLPYGYDEIPFGPQHSVRALVYEFEKGPSDGEVRRIDADTAGENKDHASRTRIYQALTGPLEPL